MFYNNISERLGLLYESVIFVFIITFFFWKLSYFFQDSLGNRKEQHLLKCFIFFIINLLFIYLFVTLQMSLLPFFSNLILSESKYLNLYIFNKK